MNCKHEPSKLQLKTIAGDPFYVCQCGATIKAKPIEFVVKRGRQPKP